MNRKQTKHKLQYDEATTSEECADDDFGLLSGGVQRVQMAQNARRRMRSVSGRACSRRSFCSIEEASAQGGAKAFTEQLGYPNADPGFPVPGGFIQQRTKDGQIDSLAYPLIYRDKGINNFMMSRKVGMNAEFDNEGNVIRDGEGMFEGKALGIGIDPRFSPETREEYYRIIDNARPRAQRMFNQVYNKYRY